MTPRASHPPQSTDGGGAPFPLAVDLCVLSVIVRFRITPQNTAFYDYFAESARHILAGAKVLRDVLGEPPDGREPYLTRLKEIEHLGDEATHQIMNAVNSSFITPFDRDDIYALASRMDDCLDHIEASLDIMVLYRVGELVPAVSSQVDVLVRMAELTAEAMPALRSMSDLQDYWIEINRLENAADQNYRRMIADLFENRHDAIEIIRLKALYDELEAAADAFETVANTVESIAVKES